jgi:superfamily II DNA or RNA helicase
VDNIFVSKVNEAYVKLDCSDEGVYHELSEYFTFEVPGARFSPQYRAKLWDGKIRLFNKQTRQMYRGLLNQINRFAEERQYKVDYDSTLLATSSLSLEEARDFTKTLGLPMIPHDYQMDGFVHAIRNKRILIVSPTASGKSLICYILCRFLLNNGRILILVPTTSLVEQLFSDFSDYSRNNDFIVDQNVHRIYAGHEKTSNKAITISTWQSLYTLPSEYFKQYDYVIGDECHLFKAKSLITIMTSLVNAKIRVGMTGTLDGTKTHKLVLEGLFGPVRKVVTTKELIDRKQLADFRIKCLILKHSKENCNKYKESTYIEEMKYLIGNQARNRFIRNLALSLEKNTLVLFQFVEDHGKILYEMLKEKVTSNDRKIYFVYGGTETEDREKIRSLCEQESGVIIVASFGVFSTGVNIRNLHNIIFASPSKSRIRNLQSIGRGLRINDNKEIATLYDIADDLRTGKKENFTLKHFLERIKIYNDERFSYKLYNIDLE